MRATASSTSVSLTSATGLSTVNDLKSASAIGGMTSMATV